MNGGLLPMAIETYLLSKDEIDISDQKGDDYRVYEDFQQSGRLKELRLISLQALSKLKERDQQNRFIQQYLRSKDAGDIFALIEDTLGNTEEGQELLGTLRGEALQEEKEKLSADQRRVYEAPLKESILVTAGPGSGKTHTLLLRLGRLIHEENISPSEILVLAYNRAIVSEIKDRLHSLLGKLGYLARSRALRVFTFHGFIRYALGDAVDVEDLKRDGDPWVDTFNRIAKQSPGHLSTKVSPDAIRFIFVDEYQDITEERYQMLCWIAGNSSKVTAIGDPDQSIYGYERARAGQTRSAEPFFERFKSDFDAKRYTISDNFRSLPDIVREAESFISLNEKRRERGALHPHREADEGWKRAEQYVEVQSHEQHAWVKALRKLLTEKGPVEKPYYEVAALFRSNAEVYRAYQLIHQKLGSLLREKSIRVVVQGETRNWTQVREVAYCLSRLQNAIEEREDANAFPTEKSVWEKIIRPSSGWPEAWDRYILKILRFLVRRFESERTDVFHLQDLLEQLQDTLRHDQGQVYKLIQLDEATHSNTSSRSPNIVVGNLHKVKGLEYDAVIMPASFEPLPFAFDNGHPSAEELYDMIEEERRVYYVGMTRARNRLIRYEWRRERALREGSTFDRRGQLRTRIGLPFEGDDYSGHVAISKCANLRFVIQKGGFTNPREYLKYMHQGVAPGDPVRLVRRGNRWYVKHEDHILAQISSAVARSIQRYLQREHRGNGRVDQLTGLSVCSVNRYSYEDARRYDEENETDFCEQWSSYFSGVGFTYIVNFAGFARPHDSGT